MEGNFKMLEGKAEHRGVEALGGTRGSGPSWVRYLRTRR